jgi:mRNA interferase RelE/StbE
MQVIFTPRAVKDLKGIPTPDRDALLAKIEAYAQTGTGDVKKLTGSPYFRLRHGDWRCIFEVIGDVIVLRVLHRREAYR